MLPRAINVSMMPELLCACDQVGAPFLKQVRDHELSCRTLRRSVSGMRQYSEMRGISVRIETVAMVSSIARKRDIHDNVDRFDT
jgi:hypothetical protein